MRKNINLIQFSAEELKKINKEIAPRFGVRNMVTSGSYRTFRGRIMQGNIAIGSTNTYTSISTIKSIGKRVKEIIDADEVYSFGIRLA